MPWEYTTKDGKPAIRWGKSNAVATYKPGDSASLERAKKKLAPQVKAIEASKKH